MASFHTNHDQVFGSREELMDWVQNVARTLGYVIVTKRSRTKNGVLAKVVLMCDRGGIPITKYVDTKIRDTASKKINCPFELIGKYFKDDGFWTLRVACDQHNHPPAMCMEGHAQAMRLLDNEYRLVADLTRNKVKPRHILSTLREQNENNASSLKTIYNARDRIRRTELGSRSQMQMVMSILHDKGYIFNTRVNKMTDELEDLFFVHPTSLVIWRAFPDVLTMDAIYKTNRFNMPFLQIVGVTSTNSTFSIAHVFMNEEKVANYTWALDQLKFVMGDNYFPRVIVTDRALALINACEHVFPEANKLLCRWHIFQSISNNCRQRVKSLHTWNVFTVMWRKLVESPTPTTYFENYGHLESLLNKSPGVLEYLNQVWLNPYKHMFVSVWTDRFLNFNNHTTNRVESQHAKLKLYLDSTKSNLDRFLTHIEEVVQSQHIAIKEKLERSRIYTYHKTNTKSFKLLCGCISKHAFSLLSKELERSNALEMDAEYCGCQLRATCGLPCAHELATFLNSNKCIPLQKIHIFWRKLDLLPLNPLQTSELHCDDELQNFKERFQNQSESGKSSWMRKLKGIYEPSTTQIGEPTIHKNNRGRPSLKSKVSKKKGVLDRQTQHPQDSTPFNSNTSNLSGLDFDLNQDPARHSLYEEPARHNLYEEPARHSLYEEPAMHNLYEEPARHNLYEEPARHSWYEKPARHNLYEEPARHSLYEEPARHNMYEEPARHSSYVNFQTHYSHPLMNNIPNFLHPYINQIQDVDGDGNCGFRSIAACFGLHQNEWAKIQTDLKNEVTTNLAEYVKIFGSDLNELYHSLDFFGSGFAPIQHWMIMYDTGILVANRYNVIVHCLSIKGCSTCFPFWSSPANSSHVAIAIAHINNNHYVKVELKEGYPMPHIVPPWFKFRHTCAAPWEEMYRNRLDNYNQLLNHSNRFNNNTARVNIDD